jgi:hypothetical protein
VDRFLGVLTNPQSLLDAILTIVLSEFPGARPVAVLLSRNGRV